VYIPAEDLRRFQLDDLGAALRGVDAEPRAAEPLVALVRFEARRAQEWFERGMRLVPLLDRRSAACVLAMAGIYRRLLRRIADDPRRVLRERVSVPAPEKAWVAARAIVGLAR
jgi:15-cis-phytoene synthase